MGVGGTYCAEALPVNVGWVEAKRSAAETQHPRRAVNCWVSLRSTQPTKPNIGRNLTPVPSIATHSGVAAVAYTPILIRAARSILSEASPRE